MSALNEQNFTVMHKTIVDELSKADFVKCMFFLSEVNAVVTEITKHVSNRYRLFFHGATDAAAMLAEYTAIVNKFLPNRLCPAQQRCTE